ncbi:MAG: hypothetical protein M1813_007266 [Trichoglossum hirsutum]|nr:MAG: hypothetical protein M1813_007266 [Trichoglossum hirsutum]
MEDTMRPSLERGQLIQPSGELSLQDTLGDTGAIQSLQLAHPYSPGTWSESLKVLCFNPNQELFLDGFSELSGVEQTHPGFEPLPLGSSGYADEDPMPPMADFEYGLAPQGTIQLSDLDIAAENMTAESDWLERLEMPQVPGSPNVQTMYTTSTGLMSSDIALTGATPDHISPEQTSTIPLRYIPCII